MLGFETIKPVRRSSRSARVPYMARPRVLLADDHALLLGAFEKLLAADCDVVGQVSDGRALVSAAEKVKPDVIVLDISMPLLNGLEAGRQIKQKLRDVKLIFLTMNEDAAVAAEAFQSGASGYLLKRSAASELITAIREVMQGRSYVTPLATEGLVGSLLHIGEHKPGPGLTSRQREVLQLLAEGHSMKEVASILNLTPRTIAFHKYQMMDQLRVKSTAELIQYAVKHHIV
jgi:DNA-binding NarL/FixJ family response regulator